MTPRPVLMASTGIWHRLPRCGCGSVATEVMLLAVAVLVLKLVSDRWGPGRLRGMASRGEAERLLGVTRLRKVRAVVRPDLHGKESGQGEDDLRRLRSAGGWAG